jgi:uncharacterized lipoprotein YbaY
MSMKKLLFWMGGVFLITACRTTPLVIVEEPFISEELHSGWVEGQLVLPINAVLKDDVWAQIELLELRDRLPPRVITSFMIEKPRSLPIKFVFKVPDGLLSSTKQYLLVATVYQGQKPVWGHKEAHVLLLGQSNRLVLTLIHKA